MKCISEVTIEYGSNDQSACRSQQPSIGNQYAVLLQRTQHIAPARHRLTNSEAEEGERHFSGDILRNQQRRLCYQYPEGFRHDMPPQNVEIGSAQTPCCQNVVAVSRAENDSPHQSGRPGPANQSDHACQEKKSAERTQMQRQECAHTQQEIKPGQRKKKLSHSHQRLVNPAPIVTRNTSEDASCQQRNEGRRDPCRNRNLAAE